MSDSTADELIEMAQRGLDGDRRALASSPSISPTLAKILLRKGDQDTLYALAAIGPWLMVYVSWGRFD